MTTTQDTEVDKVVVNVMTKAQYEAATKDSTQFYAVTDDDTYAKDADLATVAKTGSYSDLTDKPTIPTVSVTAVGETVEISDGTNTWVLKSEAEE